jgi:hypothetical protein
VNRSATVLRHSAPRRAVVNNAAIVTFVVIAGLVWGGFLLIIFTAVRKEGRKTDER